MNTKSRITPKNSILLILLAGILIRVLYVIFMPVVNLAQYDLGTVDLEGNVLTGHLGYVFYLFKNHALPNFDPREVYQFNHPPIQPILGALWVSLSSLFTDNLQVLKESLQFLTLIYSVVTLMAFERILHETDISDHAKEGALFLFAFQPTLIMTAGSLNNDGIGLMFQMLSVWFAIRWYKNRKYKDILLLALMIGLGMLSKLSAGLIAVPVAAMFIYAFAEDWKKSGKFPKKTFLQYVIFGIVCVPLGLSWAMRCLMKFDMPITYIAYLPVTSPQYVGNYSDFERMFLPNPVTLLKNLASGSIGMGWNVWVQMFRTSALGECDLSLFSMAGKLSCFLMMVMNFFVAVVAFVKGIGVYGLNKLSSDRKTPGNYLLRLFWLLSWAVMVYSYFSFAYTYPHECSMNFRYVQFAMVPGLVLWALWDKKRENAEKVPSKLWLWVEKLLMAGYGIGACLVIFFWCKVG